MPRLDDRRLSMVGVLVIFDAGMCVRSNFKHEIPHTYVVYMSRRPLDLLSGAYAANSSFPFLSLLSTTRELGHIRSGQPGLPNMNCSQRSFSAFCAEIIKKAP